MAMRAMTPKQETARHDLAMTLADVGAILTAESDHPLVITRGDERGFRLKLHEKNPDAPLSPIYLNLRTPDNPKPGPLTPEIVDFAALCMKDVIDARLDEFDAVAGIPNAGDPFAISFARYTGKFRLQLGKFGSGDKRQIATIKTPIPTHVGSVLTIDDLVTQADSKIEALTVQRNAGLVATNVLVLVDRDQGGREELHNVGCELDSVFRIQELLAIYLECGKISHPLYRRIRSYLTST
jgi:uridine monophosphate synthetase